MVLSERDRRAQSRAKGKRHAVPQARPRASEKKAKRGEERGEDPMLELAENAAAFSAGASASTTARVVAPTPPSAATTGAASTSAAHSQGSEGTGVKRAVYTEIARIKEKDGGSFEKALELLQNSSQHTLTHEKTHSVKNKRNVGVLNVYDTVTTFKCLHVKHGCKYRARIVHDTVFNEYAIYSSGVHDPLAHDKHTKQHGLTEVQKAWVKDQIRSQVAPEMIHDSLMDTTPSKGLKQGQRMPSVNTISNFAKKMRKEVREELVGNTLAELRKWCDDNSAKQAPLSEAYTHGWVHVVPNEEDATVIAEGHNKVAACVRPPPTPQHDADIIYKRLTPLLDGEKPRHDFVKEAVPGSQRNLAARLRKVVMLAHDDDDGGMEGEHKSTVMHLLLKAISEHCACARANMRGGVSSKLKSVWFKSKNFGLMYARLYPKFLGDHEGGGELHVIPEAPRVGANESERERHWLSRYVACVSCAHVRITTKVDMDRLLRLCMEDCAKLTSVDDFDVHEAMERVVIAFSEVNVAETETSPPVTTDMQVGNVGAMPPFHEDLHMLAAAAIAPSACASTQTRNLAFKSGREVCPFCGSSSGVS